MRRRQPQPLYSKLDALMASPTEPMPERLRVPHLTKMYEGLNAIERQPAPTIEDWRRVCDAVNMLETLVRMGHVTDGSGLLADATEALALAGKRRREGLPIRLSAAGIQSVRAVLEDYSAALEVVPHRAVVTCHRETEKRMHEILAGRRQAHDVEVVDL